MTEDQPFDPGLQPERTLLAWRRSSLALGLACVVGARYATPDLGALAVILGALGAIAAVASYALAARRYRRTHQGLVATGTLATGGVPVLLLTLATGAIVVGAVLYVLLAGDLPR